MEHTREALITYIEEHDYADKLDELVHEAASIVASNINNSGPAEQVHYLLENGFDIAYLIGMVEDGKDEIDD